MHRMDWNSESNSNAACTNKNAVTIAALHNSHNLVSLIPLEGFFSAMEGSSSRPSDSNSTATAASKFLSNLPSRGFLSSTVLSSNPGGMRVYICEHDTLPPESQQIKTNQTNILIRSLQLKNQKGESSSKDGKGINAGEGSRKRPPERVQDGRASAKRSNAQIGSRQEGLDSRSSDRELYSLTVERLRALLKERGLSPKGKKDELVARLRNANG
ncbi:uncharacterized protein LOC105640205 [Jatropha curcas]|uniref:uncharacterized protein LOC105640205 n=1 Tax=Jatropha curcas TaxID=180498 RepID=UPI0005FB2D6A|nr:uncharacterized protein LOC105640205 [Jatropha curcas]